VKTKTLNIQELNLLREVVSTHCPSLLPIVVSIGSADLTTDQREEIRNALAAELVQNGLGEDDEPNERGLLLERLIDLLGHI